MFGCVFPIMGRIYGTLEESPVLAQDFNLCLVKDEKTLGGTNLLPLLRQKVFMKKLGILHALTMQIVHIVTHQSEIQPSIQI